jgi:VanZ family protein
VSSILKYHVPPLLWILGCFVFEHFSEALFQIRLSPGTDKIVHAGVYFIMCWLVKRAFDHQKVIPQLKGRPYLGAFIFCVSYGVLDEFHQNSLPAHSASVFKLLAGIGGAVLYVASALLIGSIGAGEGGGRSEG